MKQFRNLFVVLILALFGMPAFAQEFGFSSGASLGSISVASVSGFSLTAHVSVFLRIDESFGVSLRGTQNYFFISYKGVPIIGSATTLALTGDAYFGPVGVYFGPQLWIGGATSFSVLAGVSLELFPRWRLFAEANFIFGAGSANNLRLGVSYSTTFGLPKPQNTPQSDPTANTRPTQNNPAPNATKPVASTQSANNPAANPAQSNPIMVVLAGTIQSALGGKDWSPNDDTTQMTQISSGVYEFVATFDAGDYEYKVTVGGSWAENYGFGLIRNGENIHLHINEDYTEVRFVVDFNNKTVFDSINNPDKV
jgi:hypothetical protein